MLECFADFLCCYTAVIYFHFPEDEVEP